MNKSFGGYGFAAGSVHGIRSFRVDVWSRLLSTAHPYVWRPGEHVMSCAREGMPNSLFSGWIQVTYATTSPLHSRKKGKAPAEDVHTCAGLEDEGCGKGLYGYWGEQENEYCTEGTLEGIIQAYGKVIMGTRGFRAEKAHVVALTVPPPSKKGHLKGKPGIRASQGRRVRELYSPHAVIFDSVPEMIEHFPPDQMNFEVEPDEEFWARPA